SAGTVSVNASTQPLPSFCRCLLGWGQNRIRFCAGRSYDRSHYLGDSSLKRTKQGIRMGCSKDEDPQLSSSRKISSSGIPQRLEVRWLLTAENTQKVNITRIVCLKLIRQKTNLIKQ